MAANVTAEEAAARANLRTLLSLVVEDSASEKELAAHGLASEHAQQEVEERIVGVAPLKHTHMKTHTRNKLTELFHRTRKCVSGLGNTDVELLKSSLNMVELLQSHCYVHTLITTHSYITDVVVSAGIL